MPSPLFSIIITCFNQRAFIADAVQSALSQRCADREIIVVDDASTDGSGALLQQIGDRIHLIELHNNIGAVESRNCGIEASRGRYLVFLDGDDALTPWALDLYGQLVVEYAPRLIISKLRWVENDIPDPNQLTWPLQVDFILHKNFLSKDRTCELSASGLVVERAAMIECGCWTPGIFHLDLIDLVSKLGLAEPALQVTSPEAVLYRAHSANSIWNVAPFVEMAQRLIEKERRGEYPGGREYRMRRRAWLGGQVLFWAKRGIQRGLYGAAVRLLLCGYDMVVAATVQRSLLLLKRRASTQRNFAPAG